MSFRINSNKKMYYKRRILDRVNHLHLKFANDVKLILDTIDSTPYSELSALERTEIENWITRLWPSKLEKPKTISCSLNFGSLKEWKKL